MYTKNVLDGCSIPFIVLGDIAFQIYHNLPLSSPQITLGIMKRHAVPSQTSLLRVLEPKIEVTTDGWRIMYHNYPVRMKVLTKDYETLRDPDQAFYWTEAWRIPNPFAAYWRSKDHLDS